MNNSASIVKQLDPREHCSECGALTLEQAGGRICPHCGAEQVSTVEEAWIVPFWPRASLVAENRRFHLGDDQSQAA